MRKLVVFELLAVFFLGTFVGLYANSLNVGLGGGAQTQSLTYASNIIDHLPFTINTTDVYYITKDVEVNGTGITILADNVVLLGQRHTITGDGSGQGIWILGTNATVINCRVRSFLVGILADDTYSQIGECNIAYNTVSDCEFGVILYSDFNYCSSNIIVDNNNGIVPYTAVYNAIVNNYARNDVNAFTSGQPQYWNSTKIPETNMLSEPYKGGNYWHDYAGSDLDGDGFGDTPYQIDVNNRDYLPLVDGVSPRCGLAAFAYASPNGVLSVTWKDNVQVDKVIIELDGVNYTDLMKVDESLGFNEYWQAEHKIVHNKLFYGLSLGTHYYRWFANDTSNHWNATELLSFNVTGTPQFESVNISPTLKVDANITCEGVSNITEIMDYVDLNFKIDDNWYTMPMTYNSSTSLYSALLPAYNQLANKTIQIYIVAKTKANFFQTSDIYIYHIPEWVTADINRDGVVNMRDIGIACNNFGKH